MKSLKYIATLTAVLALAIAVSACGGPPKDAAKATVGEAAPDEPDAAPADSGTEDGGSETEPAGETTTYTITENSSILFTGYKQVGSHSGGFAIFDGTVTVPGGALENMKITVNVDTTSLFSDDGKLTEVLLGEGFFEVDQHPSASFKSTKVEKGDQPDQYVVTGNLDMVGITKSTSFPATVTIDGDTLTTQAEFTIPRSVWELTYNGPIPDTLIKEDVLINFDVEATAN